MCGAIKPTNVDPNAPSGGDVQVKRSQTMMARFKLGQLAVVHHAGHEQEKIKPSDLSPNPNSLTQQKLNTSPNCHQGKCGVENPSLVDWPLTKT